jgi:deoxyribose-phosphate aldolase
MKIASYIDHTILKPTVTAEDILTLCREAREMEFAAVCVPPYYVALSKRELKGSNVKITTVIGFPFGYGSIASKVAEIQQAVLEGADELDMVYNLAAMKNGDWQYLGEEIGACIGPVHEAGKLLKLIIESGSLTDEELQECCSFYSRYPIDYLKTSTGYAETGATAHAVRIMRANLPEGIKIKASGGIRTFEQAKEMIEAGADRIGCSSGMKIVEEEKLLS